MTIFVIVYQYLAVKTAKGTLLLHLRRNHMVGLKPTYSWPLLFEADTFGKTTSRNKTTNNCTAKKTLFMSNFRTPILSFGIFSSATILKTTKYEGACNYFEYEKACSAVVARWKRLSQLVFVTDILLCAEWA